MTELDDALVTARKALDADAPMDAFGALRFFLASPDLADETDHWRDTWLLFGEIADAIVGPPLGDHARRAADEPTNENALYDLGYEAIEVGLPDLAAGVLHRVNALQPGEERFVTEYVAALESLGRNDLAVEVLDESPALLEESFMCRYLLAFNAIMTGDPSRAASLDLESTTGEEQFMSDRIARFLARIDGLGEYSALDEDDLRGWQFVTTGSLLLHLSPYGYDEGMNGRYAFVQDSYEMCRAGLDRLKLVLDEWDAAPPRVFHLGDRGSRILAAAAASLLDVPLAAFPEDGTDRQGLVVAYDLAAVDPAMLYALHQKRPAQPLFAHAVCWTSPPPFAPDVHTLQYQSNVAPWDERMQYDAESEEMKTVAPDDAPAEEHAERIVESSPPPSEFDPPEVLVGFARVLAGLADEALPTGLVDRATRPRFWDSSPVKSGRFN